ncbi:glycoside hydrolase [Flavobacterium aquariorum]|uniref:Glycoside hydrolase n=1 Tax=Flavobacterium aquariorum TaxID=2217670 RepID=A0A2W7U5X5_9FLAO|nr:glycoside hydrolase family 16 protein [Flavobacterium aquariorum]PZX92649.1 glycoside hydrolase [Flavobacterium aquariorum]
MKLQFSKNDFPANPKIKENFILEFNEEFEKDTIDTENWLPFYLPQWSSKKMSRPQYEINNGNLILQITKKQKPWCPEFNGEVKCSSIQTGVFSGEVGSGIGQHKFNPNCVVREKQNTSKTYLPQYGFFEIRAKSLDTHSNVVALWMIGFEDSPDKSAEICIFEVKGCNVQESKAKIGYGIHKFNDPNLKEAFYEDDFDIDVTQFHIYSAEWTPEKVIFYIDNQKIREIKQSPNYPMQFMLGIYEIPTETGSEKDKIYPKNFVIDYVRGYKHK